MSALCSPWASSLVVPGIMLTSCVRGRAGWSRNGSPIEAFAERYLTDGALWRFRPILIILVVYLLFSAVVEVLSARQSAPPAMRRISRQPALRAICNHYRLRHDQLRRLGVYPTSLYVDCATGRTFRAPSAGGIFADARDYPLPLSAERMAQRRLGR